MAGYTYSRKLTVPYHECNVKGDMTIASILHQMIMTSGMQEAELIAKGSQPLPSHLAWIIIHTQMSIENLPQAKDQIQITTQALSYNRYFCYRRFLIEDDSGNPLVNVVQSFVLIDTTTRKMTQVPEEVISIYGTDMEKKAMSLPKPTKIDHTLPIQEDHYLTLFSDIDENEHVNNTVYTRWFFDSLGMGFMLQHEIKEITIRYDKEILYGAEITHHYQMVEVGELIQTCHTIQNHDAIHCSATINWSRNHQ